MPPKPAPLFRCHGHSPLGTLLLLATDQALCGLWFADQSGIPAWAQQAPESPDHPVLRETQAQLAAYFAGQRQGFSLPLQVLEGTPFQREVWQALAHIPFGHTVSYGQLAAQLGRPRAVRALGGAVGRNPLGIVLPCHRVLGAQGQLTGYTGGIERKTTLLQLESQA